MTATDKNKNY